MTNAFVRSYSHVWGNLNRASVQGVIEEQRTYDGKRGFTFRDQEKICFDWLEKNASDPPLAWLDKGQEEWTPVERKAYDILSKWTPVERKAYDILISE